MKQKNNLFLSTLLILLLLVFGTNYTIACDTSPVITATNVQNLGNSQYTIDLNVCVGDGGSEIGWTTSFQNINITAFTPSTLTNGTNVANGSISSGTLNYDYSGQGVFVNQYFTGQCFDYTLTLDGNPSGETITFFGVNCEDINCFGSCAVYNGNTQTTIAPGPLSLPIINLTCGDNFTDGPGNYPNDYSQTYVICSTIPGEPVKLEFSSFSMEDNFDFLEIYDNNSASGPSTDYTGTNLPPTIIATNASGCITAVLNSDENTSSTGWDAEIFCGCTADAGTVTTSSGTNSISLCVGESATINTNSDYTLPPPTVGEISALYYAIYNCAPPSNADPAQDDCFSGLYWAGEDWDDGDTGTLNEDGFIPSSFTDLGIMGTGGCIWFVPITMDDGEENGNPNGLLNFDGDNDKCYATGSGIEVCYIPDLSVTIYNASSPDNEVELGESIKLNAVVSQSSFEGTYDWMASNDLSCLDCYNPMVFPLETTVYHVSVMDTLTGCVAEDEITILVNKNRDVFIPNAFTPNDDGINDMFLIFGGISVSVIRSFKIFDRWGILLWEGTNIPPNDRSYGWDGTFRGKKVNRAVFVYSAEVEYWDGVVIPYKGGVTLLR